MKKFVIILSLLTIAGCASMQLENQWKGRSATSLISRFGNPNQIKYEGFSKRVYIYVVPAEEKTANTPQEPNQPANIQTKANIQTETKINMFWINRNGMIEKAKQQTVKLSPKEKIDVPTTLRDF